MTSADARSAAAGSLGTAAVSFVIPVRNDAERLRRCLQSIVQNAHSERAEIVVVDNASEDGSADVARAFTAEVLSVPQANVATLRNRGVARSRAPVIAFVDADHEIAPAWIDAALGRLADPSIAAIGAPCYPPADGTWVQHAYDRLRAHSARARDVSWLGSGNLAVRREAFERVEGFDETLEACEDVDLCSRLRRAGYRLVDDPALVSVHLGDPSTIGALVRSEMWRGRNNLRVTLRSDRSLRSLASLAIPAVNLAALAGVVFGFALGAVPLLAASIAAILTVTSLQAVRMLRRARWTPATAAHAFAVACAYNLARALAIVWPARHRNARPRSASPRPSPNIDTR